MNNKSQDEGKTIVGKTYEWQGAAVLAVRMLVRIRPTLSDFFQLT